MPKDATVKVAAQAPTDITTRSLSLRLSNDGKPATLDAATRSVEVVCSTEMPVEVWDWDRYEIVPEVLLMSGCQMPASRQVPLLNTHWRGDISSVLGSCRELRVEGDQLLGRAHYSEADEECEAAWKKTSEGHLTDYSVGYRVLEAYYVPAGQKQTIAGREFEGPVKVATKWKVRELSTCPIGADEMAKARAATAPPIPKHKEQDMNEKLRAFLESRGLAKTATEEEAWRFLETLNVRADESGGQTEEQIRAEAARAEQGRITEIRAIAGRAGMSEEQIGGFISGNKSVEEVRKAAFDHLTSQTPQSPGFRAQIVADERDKFRAAATDSILLRANLHKDPAKPAAGALDLRGFSLRELARESLRVAGQPVGGDAMQMVGRALTTSDFPILLGGTANLALLAGWELAQESWEQWCGIGSLSDFNIHTLARAGETDDLEEVPEEGEYKYGQLSEMKEQVKLATYGKLNKISRQAIINDDLGAITDAFIRRGEAAARKVGDLPYAVLVANAAMGDGTALFHANHGNLIASGTAISVDNLGVAEDLMMSQKDIGGKRRLNIKPQFLLVPTNKRVLAVQTVNGAVVGTQALPGVINPYQGQLTVVGEARLKDDSQTAWYLAGPKGKTVVVYFLNGNRLPYLETKEGWTVDGVEFKTRIDAAAKAVDFRGLVKNPGA
jgi:hypothetical protein